MIVPWSQHNSYHCSMNLSHRRRQVSRSTLFSERNKFDPRDKDERSEHEEFLRLATMRLLRELPRYSASFKVLTPKTQIDCVLNPPSDDLPMIVVEAKMRLRESDADRVIKLLKRSVSAWGKRALGTLDMCHSDPLYRDRPIQNARVFYLWNSNRESNAFRGQGAGETFPNSVESN